MTVRVEVDDDAEGFAAMLAALIESNLTRRPERARLLRPATVGLEATDAGTVATVRLRPGLVRVETGQDSASPLRIRASSRDLLSMASTPLHLGLPDVATSQGRAVLAAVVGGRIRIRGLLRHPVALSRFARLLSVA